MQNIPSRDIELLMTYERLAHALEAMYLNHEQRGQRIALIGRMVNAPMNWATSDFLKWLYPLYHILLTLYVSNGNSNPLTHTQVKHGLRFFAEVCQEARKDLETIEANRRNHNIYSFNFEIQENPMPSDGEVVEYHDYEVPPVGVPGNPNYDPHIDELLAKSDDQLTDDDRRYLGNAIGFDYDTQRSADDIDEPPITDEDTLKLNRTDAPPDDGAPLN